MGLCKCLMCSDIDVIYNSNIYCRTVSRGMETMFSSLKVEREVQDVVQLLAIETCSLAHVLAKTQTLEKTDVYDADAEYSGPLKDIGEQKVHLFFSLCGLDDAFSPGPLPSLPHLHPAIKVFNSGIDDILASASFNTKSSMTSPSPFTSAEGCSVIIYVAKSAGPSVVPLEGAKVHWILKWEEIPTILLIFKHKIEVRLVVFLNDRGATKDMGKMLGGDEEKDPDAAKKEEERQEALRQQEEERKAKYAKMEAEREVMRQGIRDKYGIKKKEEKEAEAQAALEANAEGSLTRPKKAIPPGCGDEEEEEEESILDTVIKYLPGPLQDMFKK
ncbi:hypothetical protein IHE44_0011273 [Lamprotornis superbus]|uniref:Complexin-1 n=1 Tax=Lamprotornis superbus TaxID=245042 RepID=A0A835NNL0_9PASS|nr:hypothetical protein IHE44_0011273 [Lamprotornis superbus]